MKEINRRQLIQGGLCTASLLRMPAVAFSQTENGSAQQDLAVNAGQVPLSRLGSYLAIGFRFWDFGLTDQVSSGAYYIRCLQDDPSPPEFFRVEMLVAGQAVAATATITPGKYTLAHGRARIEFCIAENDLILMRGMGCTLRLHTITRGYANAIHRSADSWWIIPDAVRSSVEVSRRVGRMEVDALWVDRSHNVQVDKAVLTFTPGQDGAFEGTLLSLEWLSMSHASFDLGKT